MYHSAKHARYLTQYHIIWCPKFRYQVFTADRSVVVKEIIIETCRQYGYGIKALEVMPDHIHLFADLPHTTAPAEAIRILKSLTARKLFLVYPQLKTFYKRAGCLWSRGYFVSSVGHVSEDTARRYIEEQQQ